MNKLRSFAIGIVGFASGGLAVFGAVHVADAGAASGGGTFWKEGPALTREAATNAAPALPSLSGLIRTVSPSVVYIFTTRDARTSQESPHFNFGPFGGPEGPGDGRHFSQRSLGSGFIVSPDGYIVTNNHVIEGTSEIRVQLTDGRELAARIIGRDPQIDLGLIKIDAKNLPVSSLGNSDDLQQGDWVVALGNPLGLDHSASVGIVSGLARNIGIGRYDALLQTDAAINPGNSGGPLFNLRGEVVGINTAIIGGANNIGFAIPVNMAKEILPDLKEHGKAVRGQLGVLLRPVGADHVSALKLRDAAGALIERVVPGSPAARAGLTPGDVIVALNGQKIAEVKQFQREVASIRPGTEVTLTFIRDGKSQDAKARLIEFQEQRLVAAADTAPHRHEHRDESSGKLGISVSEITPALMSRYDLRSPSGVLVTRVDRGSVADDAGLRPGDVILEANRKPVKSLEGFSRTVKEGGGKSLLLLVVRDGESLFLVVGGGR